MASKIEEVLIDIGGLLGFILLHGIFLGALGCFRRACTPPGTLLAGSWEALGRLLEASKKHHEPKTGIVGNFCRIFGKIMKFSGSILAAF